MSRESDLTQIWLKWVESELSQVSKFGFWVESELSQVSKFGIWVESPGLSYESSRVSPEKWVEHNPGPYPVSLNISETKADNDTKLSIPLRATISHLVSKIRSQVIIGQPWVTSEWRNVPSIATKNNGLRESPLLVQFQSYDTLSSFNAGITGQSDQCSCRTKLVYPWKIRKQ